MKHEQRECPVCHNLFEVTQTRTKYCSIKCRGIGRRKPGSENARTPKPPRIILCGVCGTAFIGPKRGCRKFCDECRNTKRLEYARASWKTEKYKEAHRKAARAWQITNRAKCKASVLAKTHPELLTVLYECPCEATGKHHHHFDYSKPYDTILLCDSCHIKEHARLRSLAANAA